MMTFEETYRNHFGDLAWCENHGTNEKLNFILIDPDGKAEADNIICLCNKCVKAVKDGYFNRNDLKYMHIVRMNAHKRRLKIIKHS